MHMRTWFAIPCLAALVASPLPARADPFYTMTFLPDWLNGNAINNVGQMTGLMRIPGGVHAFLYTNGDVRDLGALGGTSSQGVGINDKGMVVGSFSTNGGPGHAFLYANGAMRDLGTLPGGSSSGAAWINNAGQIAGGADTSTGQRHAVLIDNDGMHDLGTLGGNYSYSSGINNAGHVVGTSNLRDDEPERHPFLYHDGVMTDLGSFGGIDSFASGINDRDQIIGGIIDAAEFVHPIIYTNGVVKMIGSFGGRFSSTEDINNLGQVVGFSTFAKDNDSRHGFLYTEGKMLDINALIDPALGWTVETALGINDEQQILGFACRTNDLCRTVRLDPITPPPVPEPGSLAMLLGGLAAGGFWRALKRSLPRIARPERV